MNNDDLRKRMARYGCGPVKLTGSDDALYERHLVFDHVIRPEEAGEANAFMFGLTADQVLNTRGWYNPRWHYEHEPETREAMELIFNNHFNLDEPGIFEPVRETLLNKGDYYLHLADLSAYVETQGRIALAYQDQAGWAEKAVHNIARSGKFSSDRTIAEYASEIWKVQPCPVS
jgi:starch phosphorylase